MNWPCSVELEHNKSHLIGVFKMIFIYLFSVCVSMLIPWRTFRVQRGHLVQIRSFLIPRAFWGLTWGQQTWQQLLMIPTESSLQFLKLYIYIYLLYIVYYTFTAYIHIENMLLITSMSLIVSRTIFDKKELLEFAQLGCYLEYDLFGTELLNYQLSPDIDMPDDNKRIRR